MSKSICMDRVLNCRFVFGHSFIGLLAVAFFCASLGCGKKTPEVRQYTVKNLDRGKLPPGREPPKTRTLGAIILQQDEAWFFKISDDLETVLPQKEPLEAFLKSVQFDDKGTPSWKLAPNWQEAPGDDFRYRTIRIPVEGRAKPVELSVSKLPFDSKEQNKDDYIAQNVNRWRGQLGLSPESYAEVEAGAKEIELSKGQKGMLVSFVGVVNPQKSMSAPFAGGDMPPPRSSAPPPRTESAPPNAQASSDLDFKVPEGWINKGAGGFRKASFGVQSGGDVADISVIDLAGNSGGLLENVNRWRGQIGLPPSGSEEEVKSASFEIQGSDITWTAFRLVGDEAGESGKAQSMLVALYRQPDRVWFVKIQGPIKLVADEESRFTDFVKSLKLKS